MATMDLGVTHFRTHQVDQMATHINWRFRMGFLLSAFLGFAWGILLGWYQVRLNAYLSPGITLLVTMPIAFWGSVFAGLAFNRMLPSWHKLARLLVALGIIIAGLPLGIVWALLGDGVEPINLIRSTGWTPWQFEWAMALLGLLGGMFPRWMLVFLRPLGNLVGWIFARPINAVRWLGNTIVGLPRQVIQAVTIAPPTNPPPPLIEPVQPQRTPRTRTRRVRTKAKPVLAPSNGNGARVVAHVEDRCPYCFDIVKRNDPRGVHVCEICHTPHHADCWAITGKCQVPHLNT